MSIYIQVPTIEDYSIPSTVHSAVNSATNPSEVYFGVAATTSESFYHDVVQPLSDIDNVETKHFSIASGRGLGRSRVNSRFAYNDQDYIIQIDAHTLFQDGWDDFLIDLYEGARRETGSDKTLMAAYLGKYSIRDDVPIVIDPTPGYPVWGVNDVVQNVPMKGPAVVKISDFPDHILNDKGRTYYPLNRTTGNFIMGNREWGKYHGWTGKEIFWEEEVLPAINLLENGFSLVFPNVDLPLTHLYWEEDLKRQTMDQIYDEDIMRLATEHIEEYVKENYDLVDKYTKFSGYDLKKNEVTLNVFIPNTYAMVV